MKYGLEEGGRGGENLPPKDDGDNDDDDNTDDDDDNNDDVDDYDDVYFKNILFCRIIKVEALLEWYELF